MTRAQDETAQEIGLMLRTDEGTTYVIPVGVVERHRLSDEQRVELEARLGADSGSDTTGHQFIGTFGCSEPMGQAAGSGPGFSAIAWLPAHYVTNTNRDDPNGYRSPVREAGAANRRSGAGPQE
jgi:hypothetical protein